METPPSVSASWLNCLRISTCCNRLSMHVDKPPKNDPLEFFNLCFSLARAIDFAVSSNEIPAGAGELPLLLKKVCRLKNETFLPPAILVLMISIKNACQRRWFSDQDSEELCRLTSELQSSFCTTMDFTTEPKSFYPTISTIMSRYHPRIKMGDLITFLEVKPGYGTYVHDFQITNDLKSSKEERIRLFVAQTDNIETSSCLINPTDVSFLLNGKGVDRRRTNFMDTGPQMPTLVNHYLKYGTNLLQAVGQFNGNYIIIISFMRMLSCPDHATLPDYVQPPISMVDSDPEIIEGPSRISLNCPISFKRIKVPVKGHMCKHLQCIDYENYMAMNVRRPSWRCPHCNQHVCFTDIRVDQNMVKVLKEVGKTVNVITISSDGSWKPAAEIDDHCDKPREKDNEVSTEPGALEPSDICPDDIMDLTEDNYMDTVELCETADKKRSSSSCQNQVNKQDIAVDSNIINTNVAHENSTVQVEDSFWRGIYLSPHESGLPNCHSNPQTSAPRNQYGEDTFMSRHASETPVSVQAHPFPSPTTSSLQHRQRDHPVIKNSSPAVPRISAVSRMGESALTVPDIMEGQQFTRTNLNPLQKSRESSSRVQQYPVSQTVGHQAPPYVKSSFNVTPVFPSGNHDSGQQQTPNTVKSSYKVTPVFPSGNHNSGQQQTPNTSESINQSSRPQTYQGGSPDGIVSNKRARELVTAHQAASNTRVGLASKTPSPYAMNYDRQGASVEGLRSNMPPPPSQPPAKADVPIGLDTDSNRQPSVGRMRGSLTGRAYLDAYNHYITRPTQQPETTTQQARATTQPGQATMHTDRAKSHPATQQARATTQPAQAILPDRSQHSKAAKHFDGAIPQPALATTQQAQATTHLHRAIKQPALAKSQQAQCMRHPVTATTQQDQVTPEQAKATTEQAKATTQQAKSTPPVSIKNLLSSSASKSLEVLAANRAALAQAGIYPNSGSGSSSGVFLGWPSGNT